MSEAPERIWAFYAPHIAEDENGATIVAHENIQHGSAAYVRADRIEELEAKLAEWQAQQHYRYIGRDGKPVLARDLEARAEAAEAKLAEAVEEKMDAISTLDAWFDRRALAHDAIDKAVIDAASGYLRTCRVGGMPQAKSDLVLGVIQNMARLSVFADLFARAASTELTGGEDDRQG